MLPRLFSLLCVASLLGAQSPSKELFEEGKRSSELSVQAFERLLQTAPESGYVLALLGDVKVKEKQYSAALYAYTEAAKRIPKLRGVRAGAAAVYREMGKPAESEAAEKAEKQMGAPDCAVEKLYCDFAAGRFAEVVRAAKLKNTPEGLYWLSRAYNELAIQAFSKLGEYPDSPEMHRMKAQMLHGEGRFSDAAQEWREILKASPEDRDAQHQLATELYLSHDFAHILPELQSFLKAEPDSPNLNFFVGDGLLQTERVEDAVPYLEKAVQGDSRLLPAHASLGLCYARLGQQKKAIPHLKAALGIDSDGALHYQLARSYQATGQAALAKAMMAKYQELRKGMRSTAP